MIQRLNAVCSEGMCVKDLTKARFQNWVTLESWTTNTIDLVRTTGRGIQYLLSIYVSISWQVFFILFCFCHRHPYGKS